MKEYDDPYNFLALYLISISTKHEIRRLLHDDEYVERFMIKELRGLDFQGPMLDAVITEILVNKKRMKMCNELDKLAHFFFTQLDLKHLRERISYYCSIYGIILEE